MALPSPVEQVRYLCVFFLGLSLTSTCSTSSLQPTMLFCHQGQELHELCHPIGCSDVPPFSVAVVIGGSTAGVAVHCCDWSMFCRCGRSAVESRPPTATTSHTNQDTGPFLIGLYHNGLL